MHQRFFGGQPQRPEKRPAQQAVSRHRQQGQPAQRRRINPHHRQRHDHHHPVQQRFRKARGQRALDQLHAVEARPDVAQVALFKPGQWQPQQVGEHLRQPLHIQRGRQIQHRPGAQRTHPHLQQHQQPEAQPQRDEQVAVGTDQHPVHHPLQQERRQQGQQFQRQRQAEDLHQRALQPGDATQQLPPAQRRCRLSGSEVGPRPQLQRHAGEVARQLAQRQAATAMRRVVNDGVAAADLGQHDEMIEVPVQDARQMELRQMRRFGPQRPAGQPQVGTHADQVRHRRPLQRERKARPQLGQIVMGTECAGHHRQAGQAAFRTFGLQDDGHAGAAAPAEAQSF